tara:strand:- start:708 stop:2951 length:2244 start_codon:yes stop_codon:yes gene_type:complete
LKYIISLIIFLNSFSCFSQELIIRGLVRDISNNPIPYANIYEINSSSGVSANDEGIFDIKVKEESKVVLKISAIGFEDLIKTFYTKKLNYAVNIELNPSNLILQEQVVSGTLELIKKKESPIPVSVYSSKYLNTVPSPSLVEATNQIAGLRPQTNCSVCNTGDVHINGMEGSYSMVVIDGMPIMGGLSTVYGLQGIPTGLIQQLEVIKGPASTLYGSEAMAGLINVVTKSVDCIPNISYDFNISSWGEFQNSFNFKILDTKNIKGYSSIDVFNYNNPIDNNKDNFTDLTLKNRYSIFNKFQFLPTNKKTYPFNLSLRYMYENRWGGEMDWTNEFRGGNLKYGESILTNRLEFSTGYQLPINEKINWQTSFSIHDQKSWYGTVNYDAKQIIGFNQLTWHKKINSKHQLLSGHSLRYNLYDDNTPATTQASIWWLPGFFVQDNFTLNLKNRLLVGWRTDYHTKHGFVNSPRINYQFDFTENSSFRIGYGNGFRVVNVFTEDHAALTGSREVVFLENLNPEISKNININITSNWENNWSKVSLESSVFQSKFSNKIIPDFMSDDNKIIYSNLDGYALSKGVSTEMIVKMNKIPLILNFNATYLDIANYDLDDNNNLIKSTQLLAEKYSIKWSSTYSSESMGLDFNYSATHYGPIRLPIVENDLRPEYSLPYYIHNFKLTKNFNSGWKFFIALRNAFNFTPPSYSILRAHDPFDKNIDDSIDNPNNYTFDASYMYASFQGINLLFGGTIVF